MFRSTRTARKKGAPTRVGAAGDFKMSIRTISAVSLVGLTTFAAPIFAGPVGIQRNVNPEEQSGAVDYVKAQRENLSRQAVLDNAKGPLMIRYMDKRAQLDDVINRLQSGQQVTPEEIDQALAPVSR
jgi:hypothetical protein